MFSAGANEFEGAVQNVECAEQVKVVANNLQLHWVNATARPSGAMKLAEFEALFQERIGNHAALDVFMEFNVGFYVQHLDHFVTRLEKYGYQYLAVDWVSPWDDETYYSVISNIPGTATVVELIGSSLEQRRTPTQHSSTERLADPAQFEQYFVDAASDDGEAPTYVACKLSFPTSYPDFASLWMQQYMAASEVHVVETDDELRHILTLSGESFVQWHWVMYPPTTTVSANGTSHVVDLTASSSPATVATPVDDKTDRRSIMTRLSAHEAVEEWEDYLNLLSHHTLVSPNCGFNQYLDFHPGIFPDAEGAMDGAGTLDDVLYDFARDKVPFRLFHAWDKEKLYPNATNATLYIYFTMPLTGRSFQLIGTASNPWFRDNTKAWTLCSESCTSESGLPTDATQLPIPLEITTASDDAQSGANDQDALAGTNTPNIPTKPAPL